jgi:hypothetical protein
VHAPAEQPLGHVSSDSFVTQVPPTQVDVIVRSVEPAQLGAGSVHTTPAHGSALQAPAAQPSGQSTMTDEKLHMLFVQPAVEEYCRRCPPSTQTFAGGAPHEPHVPVPASLPPPSLPASPLPPPPSSPPPPPSVTDPPSSSSPTWPPSTPCPPAELEPHAASSAAQTIRWNRMRLRTVGGLRSRTLQHVDRLGGCRTCPTDGPPGVRLRRT